MSRLHGPPEEPAWRDPWPTRWGAPKSRRRWFIRFKYRMALLDTGLHLAHAGPGGSLLSRNAVRFSNTAGFIIVTKRSTTWIYFRRRPTT